MHALLLNQVNYQIGQLLHVSVLSLNQLQADWLNTHIDFHGQWNLLIVPCLSQALWTYFKVNDLLIYFLGTFLHLPFHHDSATQQEDNDHDVCHMFVTFYVARCQSIVTWMMNSNGMLKPTYTDDRATWKIKNPSKYINSLDGGVSLSCFGPYWKRLS